MTAKKIESQTELQKSAMESALERLSQEPFTRTVDSEFEHFKKTVDSEIERLSSPEQLKRIKEKLREAHAAMIIREGYGRVRQMTGDATFDLSAARRGLLTVLRARVEDATQEEAAVQKINRCSNSMVRNMDIALERLQRSSDRLLGVK